MISAQREAEINIKLMNFFNDPAIQSSYDSLEEIRKKAYIEKINTIGPYQTIANYLIKNNTTTIILIVSIVLLGISISKYLTVNGLIIITFTPTIVYAFYMMKLIYGKFAQNKIFNEKTKEGIFINFIKYLYPQSKFGEIAEGEIISNIKGNGGNLTWLNFEYLAQTYNKSYIINFPEKNIKLGFTYAYTSLEQNSTSMSLFKLMSGAGNNDNTIHNHQLVLFYLLELETPIRSIRHDVFIISKENSINIKRNNKISTEDQSFNKYYEIYCDDEIEARTLLTSNLLNQLTQLYEKHKKSYVFQFYGKHIYIINDIKDIQYGRLVINPDKPLLEDFKPYKDFCIEIEEIKNIANTLNVDYLNG